MIEIKIGERVKIPSDEKLHPERGHFGTCVWIRKDGKAVGIECEKSHRGKKNTVFIVRINDSK